MRASAVGLVALLLSCQASSDRFAAYDLPGPGPVALGAAVEEGPVVKRKQGMSAERAAECGRGTGRNAEGVCVALTTRDAGYVERVMIPAGRFVMGALPPTYDGTAARRRPGLQWSGQPPRMVELSAFWIDLHEVRHDAYAECVAGGQCTAARCADGKEPTADLRPETAAPLPQTCVTHEQAAAFCKSRGGDLPTEAQWEYAARGIDARIFPWGNEADDSLPQTLTPVGSARGDVSYFGILGMASNGGEWVADAFDEETALRPFLEGPFRDPAGPLARSHAAFEAKLACGDAPRCAAPPNPRWVLKGTRSGDRLSGRERWPEFPEATELEGYPLVSQHPRVGFRCAAPLGPDDTSLAQPDPAPPVPLLRQEGSLVVFGGVAEAASRKEAQRFCSRLRVTDGVDPVPKGGFRLPTLAEVRTIAASFRGPGPFWLADGAAFESAPGAWEPMEADAGEALLARCVRP